MEKLTNIRSLLEALSRAMNLINPEVENHHQQTAYFAYFIGREMGLDTEELHLAIYAALLHDVGSVVMNHTASVLEIEAEAARLAGIGASMLSDLPAFHAIAEVIRYCQLDYTSVRAYWREFPEREQTLRIASLVHVADAASTLLHSGHVLNQVDAICACLDQGKGTQFDPEALEALYRLKPLEVIWLDALNNPSFLLFFTGEMHAVTAPQTIELTRLMSRIIDYRSPFTAMHSAGVSASAKALARLAGMTEEECLEMEIAGNLHDVGKLVVPESILTKPGKLTAEEFNIMKEHAYYTRFVLMDADGFDQIANWAGGHHEKLDGNGYPFHWDKTRLDTGCRIMAVADIFSATAEDRPYRKGMKREQIERIMREDAACGKVDAELVALLFSHYEEVNDIRDEVSHREGRRYYESMEGTAGEGI